MGLDASGEHGPGRPRLPRRRRHARRVAVPDGSPSQLESVWKECGIEVEIQQGPIDHTPALFEIDPQGRFRKVYLSQMSYPSIDQQAQVLADDASRLLPNHPRLLMLRSYRQIPPIGPAAAATLPKVGGGSVRLPLGSLHVILSFARWIAETSDLAGQLDQHEAHRTQAPG
jgi:hypothetical protein